MMFSFLVLLKLKHWGLIVVRIFEVRPHGEVPHVCARVGITWSGLKPLHELMQREGFRA